MAAAPNRSLTLSMQLGSSHYRGHDIDDDATVPVIANPAQGRPARAPPVPLPVHLSHRQRPRRSLAEDRLPLSRTVSSGATLVANRFINSRRSASHILEWEYHPALAGSRASRIFSRYYRYLTRQAEVLSTDFSAEALLLELTDLEREKVKQLYVARINHINKWVIPDCLVRTRFCLCLLEIVGVVVLALFITALAVTGGRQQGLMQGAEVSLIVLILMAAMTMNYARIRRWTCLHTLRILAREWSPEPTSVSPALASIYASLRRDMPHADLELAVALRDRTEDGNIRSSSRWTIRNHTGGWWTSWRPVIHVELFAPIVAPPPPHPGGEDFVPAYSPRQSEGEKVIQFSP